MVPCFIFLWYGDMTGHVHLRCRSVFTCGMQQTGFHPLRDPWRHFHTGSDLIEPVITYKKTRVFIISIRIQDKNSRLLADVKMYACFVTIKPNTRFYYGLLSKRPFLIIFFFLLSAVHVWKAWSPVQRLTFFKGTVRD